MRIAIVLNSSWNVYNFRLGLISALRNHGHQIVVVAPEDTYSQKLADLGYEFRGVEMDGSGVNPVKDALLILRLYRLYKEVKPDVVLHYTVKPNTYGTLAATLLGIPSINNVCGLGTVFLKKGLFSEIAKVLYKLAFRFPRKVFFQNEDDYQLFIEQKLIREDIADAISGSGINLHHFKPQHPHRLPDKKFTFLVISRIIYDKGIIEYIDAIKMMRARGIDARFQLLGAKAAAHKRGICEELIEAWIREGLIEYLGTTDDVQSFINAADCVVLPSYREGLPRTLLEAASLCKPIVTTNVPGCRQVVADGVNGLLCEVRNAEDLADKMQQILNLSHDELMNMGLNGRIRVEMLFDEELVINKYIHAIDALSKSEIGSQKTEENFDLLTSNF